MSTAVHKPLRIGISSRALFDLEDEHAVFETEGVNPYHAAMLAREDGPLLPGTAFSLVKKLADFNRHGACLVELVLMSRSSPDVGLRVLRAATTANLPVQRSVFTGGQPLAALARPFGIDLFLSRHAEDVADVLRSGVPAAVVQRLPAAPCNAKPVIHVAFDGDCVLFGDEAENVYRLGGVEAFVAHEIARASTPLPSGPFAPLLRQLVALRQVNDAPAELVISVVTARSVAAHERVLRTLRAWGVTVDQAYFMGGEPKGPVLAAIGADFFFDDQASHIAKACGLVACGQVPSFVA